MDNQITSIETVELPIDCACVIHGDVYNWTYVERLYNMLSRNLSRDIRFHVYTEAERPVPAPMIKHVLPTWNINGPRRGWWYKMCLFDVTQHAGSLLYFDLDTVIVNNVDWICNLPLTWFWTVRDFKYLWRPSAYSINSSIMWWDTRQFGYIWEKFQKQDIHSILKRYRGDQDFIAHAIDMQQVRFLDEQRIKSWRWECLEKKYDFRKKPQKVDEMKTSMPQNTDILVFHGQPKPADLQDEVLIRHWR